MVRLIFLLAILCSPALAEGNLTLRITADPGAGKAVVGEMIPVTIRGVYDRKIAIEKLHLPPSGVFDWIQTGPDDWHEEMIGGLRHVVMERHLALWPKRAGLLSFGPVRHQLTVIDLQSRRQEAEVMAQPLALSVGAFPSVRGWNLAAAAVELTDELSVDASRLGDGESAIRRVTLRALGALPEHLPPRPVISENWLITFAAPVTRSVTLTDKGPVAEVVWTWHFRPHTGEPGVLDPVTIPWFNTETRQMAAVEIPALPIALASFYTNQTETGRIGAGQIASMAAVLMAGLLAGLILAAKWLAPDATAAGWARLVKRWSPAPRVRLWLARRRGDIMAERRAAEEAGLPETVLAALDRAIYGRPK